MNALKYSALCLLALNAASSAKLRTNKDQMNNKNLVVNGDFEFPQVDTHDVFQAIPGWQGTANVEIGKGNLYNSKLSGNNQVAELDVYENTTLYQTINLDYDTNCLLNLQYGGRDDDFGNSGFKVYFNNKLAIADTDGVENLFNVKVHVKGKTGPNRLVIQGTGPSDSKGVVIDKVSLTCEDLVNTPGGIDIVNNNGNNTCDVNKNYILNGSFSAPSLAEAYNAEHYAKVPSIDGWTSEGLIELGFGSKYNSVWTEGNQVVDLDQCKNDPIFQRVYINRVASCRIVFDHAATKADSSNGFSVYFNGKRVFYEPLPSSTKKFNQSIEVVSTKGQNVLAFKGEGAEDNHGQTIDNVQLYCACPDTTPGPVDPDPVDPDPVDPIDEEC